MPRRGIVCAYGWVVALLAVACGGSRTPAELPVEPSCELALAPFTERLEGDGEIRRLQDRARSASASPVVLENLAYRFIARARRSYDPGDYLRAEQAGRCLQTQASDSQQARLLLGHVLHQQHRFAEAETLARVLVRERGDALDYGLLGDVLMEQGRLDEAVDAYQRMVDLKPFYQAYVRSAHVRWLVGDLDGARELMRMALGATSPRDPDTIAWASARLGLYELQAGDLQAAERAIALALEAAADHPAALLARGRLLLAQGRAAEACEPLQRAAGVTREPEYEWALLEALAAAGRDEEAREVERDLEATGARRDPRTLSIYLATRGRSIDAAVALASRELEARQDVHTLDAAAWALAAAGRLEDATPLMERALSQGTEDARILYHAGVIADRAGRPAQARHLLGRAHAIARMLLPTERADLERRLAAS